MVFSTYKLLDKDEVSAVLKQVENYEWTEGLARTKKLTGTVKQNLEILDSAGEAQKSILVFLGKTLMNNPDIMRDHIPHKAHAPKFNKYQNGGQYHRHVDAPTMGQARSDLSCTIFLSDPDSYEGGELCIEDERGEIHSHKGKAGECIVYTCGQPHWVNPVTKGERICAITWIQSRIRDPHKRYLLSKMRKTLAELEDSDNSQTREWFTDFGAIHSDLLRMWME